MLEINKKKLVPGIVATWGDITGNVENQEDLVEYIDNHTPEVVWGGITGDITDQEDLQEELSLLATKSELSGKQDTLVSGVNIKTVNDQSLLGPGNITIEGGGEENVIEIVKVNGTDLTPDVNKAVDVIVPTKTSDLTNDSGYITSASLSGYATEQWVENQGYLPEDDPRIEPFLAEEVVLGPRSVKSVLSGPINGSETYTFDLLRNLYSIDDSVYLIFSRPEGWGDAIYTLNQDTLEFELNMDIPISFTQSVLWSDNSERLFIMSGDQAQAYILQPEEQYYELADLAGENWIWSDFQKYNAKSNIIHLNGHIYMANEITGVAWVYDEDQMQFTQQVPFTTDYPKDYYFNWLTNYNGHLVYIINVNDQRTMMEINEHYENDVLVSLSVDLVQDPYFPLYYEQWGETLNVGAEYIIKQGLDYLLLGRYGVIYRVENSTWVEYPIMTDMDQVTTANYGCKCRDLVFGYGSDPNDPNHTLVWNFSLTKSYSASKFFTDLDARFEQYATQDWVSGQGYAYGYQLENYVYDPLHRLELTGSGLLVDGKKIANTDMCIVNRTIIPGGPDFVQEGYAMDLYFDSYFITPSGRMIYMPLDESNTYFEWDSVNKQWNQNQWSMTNMISRYIMTTTDGKVFYMAWSDIYMWDDLNSEWIWIINMPQDMQDEFDVWVCGTTLRFRDSFKLTETGGVWSWETVTTLLDYHSGRSIVCNSNVYILDGTYIYQYDEATTTYTQLGSVNTDGWQYSNFFVFNNELYLSVPRCVFQIDFSRVDPLNPTVDLEIDTDFYHIDQNDGYNYFYGEYDHQLYTTNQRYEFGYCQKVTESVPAVPAQDGTYVLKATVLNGQVTYSWVVDEVAQAVQITNEILS